MIRICNDTCNYCIYIGEGDFICSKFNELVIVDWMPVNNVCIKKQKRYVFNDIKNKKNLRKK